MSRRRAPIFRPVTRMTPTSPSVRSHAPYTLGCPTATTTGPTRRRTSLVLSDCRCQRHGRTGCDSGTDPGGRQTRGTPSLPTDCPVDYVRWAQRFRGSSCNFRVVPDSSPRDVLDGRVGLRSSAARSTRRSTAGTCASRRPMVETVEPWTLAAIGRDGSAVESRTVSHR